MLSLYINEHRLSPHIFFSLTSGNKFLFFITGIIAYTIYKPGGTSISAIAITLVFYAWLNFKELKKIPYKMIIISATFLSFSSIYFLTPLFDTFIKYGYDGIKIVDNNITWRLMFWTYLFNEKFVHYPIFGIGFGSPLFDLTSIPKFITSDDGTRLTEFTLGTHNSFYFVAIRLGIIGFSLLLAFTIKIYTIAFKTLNKVKNSQDKSVLIALILANLLFLNSSLFNVVLESPLYALNYWFTLSLMYSYASKINTIK